MAAPATSKKLDLTVFGAEPAPTYHTRVINPTIVVDRDQPKIRLPKLYDGETGRPSKLNPERSERIVSLIRQGATHAAAAGSCGIEYSTFVRWIARGKQDLVNNEETPYAHFALSVLIAEYELENDLALKWNKITTEPTVKRKQVFKGEPVRDEAGNIVLDENGNAQVTRILESETVEESGDGVWQGIAEFMARRFSGRWKRVERVETTGADGGPVEVSQTVTIDVEKLSPMGREVLLAEFKRIKESEQKSIGEGSTEDRKEDS